MRLVSNTASAFPLFLLFPSNGTNKLGSTSLFKYASDVVRVERDCFEFADVDGLDGVGFLPLGDRLLALVDLGVGGVGLLLWGLRLLDLVDLDVGWSIMTVSSHTGTLTG